MVRVGGEALAVTKHPLPTRYRFGTSWAREIGVDHARAGIGAHPVRPDLVARRTCRPVGPDLDSDPSPSGSWSRRPWPRRAPSARTGRRCSEGAARGCRSSPSRPARATRRWRESGSCSQYTRIPSQWPNSFADVPAQRLAREPARDRDPLGRRSRRVQELEEERAAGRAIALDRELPRHGGREPDPIRIARSRGRVRSRRSTDAT